MKTLKKSFFLYAVAALSLCNLAVAAEAYPGNPNPSGQPQSSYSTRGSSYSGGNYVPTPQYSGYSGYNDSTRNYSGQSYGDPSYRGTYGNSPTSDPSYGAAAGYGGYSSRP